MGDRRIGVAVDFSPCSIKALRWAIDNLVRDGDHLILLHTRSAGKYESGGEMQLWETTGSPLIPLVEVSHPETMSKYGVKPDPETLDVLNTASKQKKVTVVMKIYWGDPREKICEAIELIPLTSLVIGNRGFGKLKRVIMGSVSNYVVDNGTCPITVVKGPEHDA
ncbi:Universal stress protein PHOS32 [Linum grandiflorum]